jgi:hypothetical protein
MTMSGSLYPRQSDLDVPYDMFELVKVGSLWLDMCCFGMCLLS